MVRMERVQTGDLRRGAKSARNIIEKSAVAKMFLRLLGVFGVALVMSDGVLTPAQSVLGAIQGIEIVAPNIGKPTIVGVSCAILVLLFFVQPFGTTKLASSFAPIVILWLSFNLTFGIYVSSSTSQAESPRSAHVRISIVESILPDRTEVKHQK
jgi:KUP system potassium uptake protein